MLSSFGSSQGGFCDGHRRRSFLQIGGLAVGGLTLNELLRAEAQNPSAIRGRQKSVVVVFACWSANQDRFDLKVDAPLELRGEFHPTSTNVPGIQTCELLLTAT